MLQDIHVLIERRTPASGEKDMCHEVIIWREELFRHHDRVLNIEEGYDRRW